MGCECLETQPTMNVINRTFSAFPIKVTFDQSRYFFLQLLPKHVPVPYEKKSLGWRGEGNHLTLKYLTIDGEKWESAFFSTILLLIP